MRGLISRRSRALAGQLHSLPFNFAPSGLGAGVKQRIKQKFDAGLLVHAGLLAVFAAAGMPLDAQSNPNYGLSETRDVMIVMRDGVKLATDIYRPTQNAQLMEGRFPVILLRTPTTRKARHRLRAPLCRTDMWSCSRTYGADTSRKGTGVRTLQIPMTGSIPLSGLALSLGAMEASVPWVRPMQGQRNMPSPLAMLPM